MSIRGRTAEQLASDRNLCGAIVAVAAAVAGLAQAVGAPVAVRVFPASVAIFAAAMALVFHLLERAAVGTGGAESSRRVPRADLTGPLKFVNRHDELAKLDELLDRAERGEGPLVVVLGGLPGVGKSAIGRHWASRVRERFHDGDLVADFSARRRGASVDVSGFLADFIRQLGPPDAVVPATVGGRVDRFRSITVNRRLLVLLDDVSEVAHVTQLRPAGRRSVVIATSYRGLEELFYGGAELIPVDPLPLENAQELLVTVAGDFGAAFKGDTPATEDLIGFCGGLPLPLCVCATRLMLARGKRSVGELVTEVRDEQRRLDFLSGKGEYAGAAVFGFAYGDLTGEEQLAYRRLGLHPGLEVAAVHAAVLSDLPLATAEELMAGLADTHLLEAQANGRYRFHDLVRLHARESGEREDSQATREGSLSGLVNWYRACLRAADWALITERIRLAPSEPISAPYVPAFTDREPVFEWLEGERANILAVLQCAQDREWDEWVWQMVESLWLFYYNRRHYADWIDATKIGVESAQRAGNTDAEARMRTQLAWAYVELGHFEQAHALLDRATRGLQNSAHSELKGSVREFTGACFLKQGDYDSALAAFAESREVFLRAGSSRGVALQDYFIGWALVSKGENAEALKPLYSCLSTMRTHDDQMFVGRALLRVGQATLGAGDIRAAEESLREALTAFGELGMRVEEAETYEQLAEVADARSERKTARAQRERAQAIYRALGHPRAGEPSANVTASPAESLAI